MTTTHEIYIDDLDIELEVTVKSYTYSTGIGSYEYWGSCEYDEGESDTEIDTIEYDNTQFSDQENAIIVNFLKVNDKDIRDQIYKEIENQYK